MSMDHNFVRSNVRMAGLVKRYHEWPVSREQTVAEHTWHVMTIYHRIFGRIDSNLVLHLLYDDAGELGVGDLPYPIKRDDPDLRSRIKGYENASLLRQGIDTSTFGTITPWQKQACKICDLIEMLEFGVDEIRRGYTYGQPVARATHDNILLILQKDDPPIHWEDRNKIKSYINKVLEGINV